MRSVQKIKVGNFCLVLESSKDTWVSLDRNLGRQYVIVKEGEQLQLHKTIKYDDSLQPIDTKQIFPKGKGKKDVRPLFTDLLKHLVELETITE